MPEVPGVGMGAGIEDSSWDLDLSKCTEPPAEAGEKGVGDVIVGN